MNIKYILLVCFCDYDFIFMKLKIDSVTLYMYLHCFMGKADCLGLLFSNIIIDELQTALHYYKHNIWF
jgi:hypothetical protein